MQKSAIFLEEILGLFGSIYHGFLLVLHLFFLLLRHFVNSDILFLLLVVVSLTLLLNIFRLLGLLWFVVVDFFRLHVAFLSSPYLFLFLGLTILLNSFLLECLFFPNRFGLFNLLGFIFLLGFVSEISELLSHPFSLSTSILS
jgi:hypothetical protein